MGDLKSSLFDVHIYGLSWGLFMQFDNILIQMVTKNTGLPKQYGLVLDSSSNILRYFKSPNVQGQSKNQNPCEFYSK